ncbi:hypothetical protein EON63_17270, partial [archaeon]
MSSESLKMVLKAFPAGAWTADKTGALPLHWITHNAYCNTNMITSLISANPKVNTIHHHIPYTIYHTPYTIYHIPYTIHHTSYTIHHIPYTIHHTPYTIYHIPHTIYHTPYTIHH